MRLLRPHLLRSPTRPVAVALASSLAAALAAASPGASPAAPEASCGFAKLPRAAPAGESTQWGHVRSLVRKGSRYELGFDPALWLGGITAQRAAVADGSLEPGEPVPNDYYVRDLDHKLLVFRVPAGARVTVLVQSTRGICSTAIPVSELAAIVKGGNPKHRRLFDRQNGLGFWIRVATDTVRSLDQQYQP